MGTKTWKISVLYRTWWVGKIETNLTGLKGEIEAGEYGDAMSQLDQSIFLLEHIEDKYAFNLQNIF